MTPSHPAAAAAPVYGRIIRNIVPLLFIGYVVSFLDRVNVGFAKLQMASDLAFSDAVYGFGAGVFFIGYFLFEVPSNMVLARVGARLWMARIMLSWGVISCLFMFLGDFRWGGMAQALNLTDAEFGFYLLRFLLGVAEAGFYPGVILYLTYWFPASRRAHVIALFMTAVGVSSVIGAPLSGAILQFADGLLSLRGWQWLFLLEGLPSVLTGFAFLIMLPDRPSHAKWLSPTEAAAVTADIQREDKSRKQATLVSAGHAFTSLRIWIFALSYMTGTIAIYAVSFWLPTIVQSLGIPPGDYFRVGLLSMIPWTVMIIVQVLWGRHSDRTRERRLHSCAGNAMAAIGLAMLAVWPQSPVLALTGLSLVTAGCGCSVVTFWPMPQSLFAGTAAAAGIALINSMGALGGYIGPMLIGQIRAANDGDATVAFIALAVIAALGGVLVLAASSGLRDRPDTQPSDA
jgi:MFS family permease